MRRQYTPGTSTHVYPCFVAPQRLNAYDFEFRENAGDSSELPGEGLLNPFTPELANMLVELPKRLNNSFQLSPCLFGTDAVREGGENYSS